METKIEKLHSKLIQRYLETFQGQDTGIHHKSIPKGEETEKLFSTLIQMHLKRFQGQDLRDIWKFTSFQFLYPPPPRQPSDAPEEVSDFQV